MGKKITQKSLLLSIFQASSNQSIPVKTLIEVGEIFGFAGSTVRVTVIRLVRDGTLESDNRGMYRLSDKGQSISRYIGTWKEGERRIREWDGSWLCYLLSKSAYRISTRTKRFLDLAGFREGLPNLWVRPDNLAVGIKDIEEMLNHGGHRDHMEHFTAHGFDSQVIERWCRVLWPVEILLDRQALFLEKIEKSGSCIEKMPLENALMESFLVGSEAIHLLFSDPLLPHEIMDPSLRQKLTRAMKAYDEVGRRIWSIRFEGINMNRSPAHLHMVANASA